MNGHDNNEDASQLLDNLRILLLLDIVLNLHNNKDTGTGTGQSGSGSRENDPQLGTDEDDLKSDEERGQRDDDKANQK